MVAWLWQANISRGSIPVQEQPVVVQQPALFAAARMCHCTLIPLCACRLPAGAIAAAGKAGKAQDVFYCLKLLEATGISTVPGTGFGQAPGTFHLRTTILPLEEDMPAILDSWRKFHEGFMLQK